MEKKQYTTPKMEVNEMETMAIIAGSNKVTSIGGGVFNSTIGGGTAARGNSRRDAWSNGWDED